MKLFVIGMLAIAFAGCETTRGSGQRVSSPVSEECRFAKADFQICYGSCLSSTTGTFLQAAGKCGNECRRESIASARACR